MVQPRLAQPTPERVPQRLELGLTEFNAPLVRPPGDGGDPAFTPFRERAAALRPKYIRIVVDWYRVGAALSGDPDLAIPQNGCVRDIAPCEPFAGLRDQLRAVREQQDAGGGWEAVVVIAWVPPWAALPASGCERPGASERSRPITDAGMDAYRRLIRAVAALGRQEGVPLRWWSPYNEPNHPSFVSPQRDACDAASPSRAPAVYTRFVRAAQEELARLGGDRRLVLGELAGFAGPSPRGTGVGEFVSALPDDVACSGAVWAQHQYVRPDGRQFDAVGELERTLDARPCTTGRPVWVTETGVGGVLPGRPRATDDATLRAQCRAQFDQLLRWDADDRVTAVFQYTLRDDPIYPVALFDPGLTRAWPVYDAWRAWADTPAGAPPPQLPPSCS
ncbi:hypothetical protein C7Y72_16740 [Paraconexibacter algicola]|uniref:Uncharacterized protein n=1 Tax=Paraconexibacter algicola TaxID=2133960 RepID=A0A2T4UFM7_9ACTN|nr:hypothetical protein C7Y72_16740 [Paraconexibacter algicola]